ncbi:unnamed protein product [Dicrocoelium dendriticum]|nr:unnamed protein product [Dicrocoelium dendriticum]
MQTVTPSTYKNGDRVGFSHGQPVVTQPVLVRFFRDRPMSVQCPLCSKMIVTRTSYAVGNCTLLASALACLTGGALGCCFIPFCLKKCKDVDHTCPSCNGLISTYAPM